MRNWIDIFDYSKGRLFWKLSPGGLKKIGDEAGWDNGQGYVKIVFKQKGYKRSHIVYEMHHGPIPDGMVIDHINRDRADDRVENLRLVDMRGNAQNRGNHSKYGIGVCYEASRQKPYKATIRIAGLTRHLGWYTSPEEAAAAYGAAVKVLKLQS
jgi:hypothetical protein